MTQIITLTLKPNADIDAVLEFAVDELYADLVDVRADRQNLAVIARLAFTESNRRSLQSVVEAIGEVADVVRASSATERITEPGNDYAAWERTVCAIFDATRGGVR